MTEPGRALRVAVIGVGHLGQHHARILAAHPGVELVAVVDTDRQRAESIAQQFGIEARFAASDLLAGRVDAVTVAVPTVRHRDVACPFLEAGIPVLVEKPMAASLDEADALIAAGRRGGALLAVGHTERFNPALAVARTLVTDPRFIEVHRLGAFQPRSLDIDVVFDLMIHDLDILLSLVAADVESVEAVGVPVLTGRVDIANARLRFANGCIANLTASRISRDQVRKTRCFQPAAYVSVDYVARKTEVWRLVAGKGPAPSIEGGELPVPDAEPLAHELADFVDAVARARPPAVTGEQGRRALALAQQITDAMTTRPSSSAWPTQIESADPVLVHPPR